MEKNNSTNTSTPDYTIQDEDYEQLLSTILTQSKIEIKTADDLKKTILEEENYVIAAKNDTVKLDCIKAEENCDDIFYILTKYDEVIYNYTSSDICSKIKSQLINCNPYDCTHRDVKPPVSPMSSIENLVEQTYHFDQKLKFQMAEEICYMRMLAHKWRPIGGDGNCFYRSVMFSYLENLIFNKDIVALQRIIVEIEEKFSPIYKNTKNLPKSVKDPIINLNKQIVITILKIIIDILDSISEKKLNSSVNLINDALTMLTKSFNYCTSFDIGMILYLRYKLYEFILENKEKYFSDDFPVKIGNLLPFQYETEEGTFLYDSFFSEELLKLYTYAEKIAIYLTPFAMKINIRVIFYDFGKDCNIQTKDFSSLLPNKETLMILYRKAHYDIAYSKEYLNMYSKYINHFNDLKNELRVVNESLINYYGQNQIQEVDLLQSKIFNKKDKNKPKEEITKKETIVAEDNKPAEVPVKIENNLKAGEKSINKEEIIKIDTKVSVIQQLEQELEELKEKQIMLTETIQKEKEKEKEKPENEELRLSNENYVKVDHDDLKSFMCIGCLKDKDPKKEKFLKLPCGCCIYDSNCAEDFMKALFNDFSLDMTNNSKMCICKQIFTIQDLMKIVADVEEIFGISTYKGLLINSFRKYCMKCMKSGDHNGKNKNYKDSSVFLQFLKVKHLEHYTCKSCEALKSNECKICNSHHLHVLNI